MDPRLLHVTPGGTVDQHHVTQHRKPAKVVARSQDLGLPIRVFEPVPVTPEDLALSARPCIRRRVLARR